MNSVNLNKKQKHVKVNQQQNQKQQPVKKGRRRLVEHKVIIDSRDRNKDYWSSPSRYKVILDVPIKNVLSVELTEYNVPFVRPLIHSSNNKLYYSTDGGTTVKTVELTGGDYYNDGYYLAIEIQTKLGADITSVTYNYITDKLTFTANDNNFVFMFGHSNYGNGLHTILGFDKETRYASDTSLVIESQYKINMSPETYIIMMLNNISDNISNNNLISRSFGILTEQFNNMYFSKTIKREFMPMVDDFSVFNIEFYDYYGNLYDFQNQDHRLEFRLIGIM
ncbi:hypothetical protein [Heterosigma akashiwo virus 01]|jgi:hypothetical protein|uniref:DUF5901 domain-containing protein n=1 Tax=Heterosigma akashiwo virus 01 TaxID=97195 RepID=A0A1C9C5A6_HAV01|nr:hypothetical protein D1R72_gp136 [Heterosigma akashiwo virus 01]AOM63467.1 hypothetical protein [Heterosigma akashiwo virus 01]